MQQRHTQHPPGCAGGQIQDNRTGIDIRIPRFACRRVEDLRAAGDRRIVFWDGDEFTGADEDIMDGAFSQGEECTADFQHKSDMGFFIMTGAIEKRLRAFEAAEE